MNVLTMPLNDADLECLYMEMESRDKKKPPLGGRHGGNYRNEAESQGVNAVSGNFINSIPLGV